jgi:hypothetical protein
VRKGLVFTGCLLALAAYAGRQGKDAAVGAAPSASTDGVPLDNVVGCRCSIRVDAGTDAVGSNGFASTGWKLYPWYYDEKLAIWSQANSSLHCSAEARLDGGLIRAFVCPDIVPTARFGRIACSSWGITGYDGGSGADLISDAGVGPQPKVRTECWGPAVTNDIR